MDQLDGRYISEQTRSSRHLVFASTHYSCPSYSVYEYIIHDVRRLILSNINAIIKGLDSLRTKESNDNRSFT